MFFESKRSKFKKSIDKELGGYVTIFRRLNITKKDLVFIKKVLSEKTNGTPSFVNACQNLSKTITLQSAISDLGKLSVTGLGVNIVNEEPNSQKYNLKKLVEKARGLLDQKLLDKPESRETILKIKASLTTSDEQRLNSICDNIDCFIQNPEIVFFDKILEEELKFIHETLNPPKSQINTIQKDTNTKSINKLRTRTEFIEPIFDNTDELLKMAKDLCCSKNTKDTKNNGNTTIKKVSEPTVIIKAVKEPEKTSNTCCDFGGDKFDTSKTSKTHISFLIVDDPITDIDIDSAFKKSIDNSLNNVGNAKSTKELIDDTFTNNNRKTKIANVLSKMAATNNPIDMYKSELLDILPYNFSIISKGCLLRTSLVGKNMEGIFYYDASCTNIPKPSEYTFNGVNLTSIKAVPVLELLSDFNYVYDSSNRTLKLIVKNNQEINLQELKLSIYILEMFVLMYGISVVIDKLPSLPIKITKEYMYTYNIL